MKEVRWEDNLTNFLGRNGMGMCSGVCCSESVAVNPIKGRNNRRTLVVMMEPITSRGDTGRGYIEIPIDKVDEVIACLQIAKADAEKNLKSKAVEKT